MLVRLKRHIHKKWDDLSRQVKKRFQHRLRLRHLFYLAALIALLLLTMEVRDSISERIFFHNHPDGFLFWEHPAEVFLNAVKRDFHPKGVNIRVTRITPGLHYWRVMSTNQIGMETFLASNPFLTSLNATVGEQVVTPDKGGALHYISKGETLGIISKIYNIPESEIRKFNKIGPFHPLKPGRVLFIPKGKPRVFTREFFPRYIARKQFIVPTNGWVASRGFGYHINPFTGKMAFHKGIDMKASAGTPIFAVMDGTVTTAGPAGTYGNLVIIRHNNGMETYYAHCSRIFVRPGEEVKQRKCIATVGDTGWATVPHLHFEIRTNGIPVDPLRYLW